MTTHRLPLAVVAVIALLSAVVVAPAAGEALRRTGTAAPLEPQRQQRQQRQAGALALVQESELLHTQFWDAAKDLFVFIKEVADEVEKTKSKLGDLGSLFDVVKTRTDGVLKQFQTAPIKVLSEKVANLSVQVLLRLRMIAEIVGIPMDSNGADFASYKLVFKFYGDQCQTDRLKSILDQCNDFLGTIEKEKVANIVAALHWKDSSEIMPKIVDVTPASAEEAFQLVESVRAKYGDASSRGDALRATIKAVKQDLVRGLQAVSNFALHVTAESIKPADAVLRAGLARAEKDPKDFAELKIRIRKARLFLACLASMQEYQLAAILNRKTMSAGALTSSRAATSRLLGPLATISDLAQTVQESTHARLMNGEAGLLLNLVQSTREGVGRPMAIRSQSIMTSFEDTPKLAKQTKSHLPLLNMYINMATKAETHASSLWAFVESQAEALQDAVAGLTETMKAGKDMCLEGARRASAVCIARQTEAAVQCAETDWYLLHLSQRALIYGYEKGFEYRHQKSQDPASQRTAQRSYAVGMRDPQSGTYAERKSMMKGDIIDTLRSPVCREALTTDPFYRHIDSVLLKEFGDGVFDKDYAPLPYLHPSFPVFSKFKSADIANSCRFATFTSLVQPASESNGDTWATPRPGESVGSLYSRGRNGDSTGSLYSRGSSGDSTGSLYSRGSSGLSTGSPYSRVSSGLSTGSPYSRVSSGDSTGSPYNRVSSGDSTGSPYNRVSSGDSTGSMSGQGSNLSGSRASVGSTDLNGIMASAESLASQWPAFETGSGRVAVPVDDPFDTTMELMLYGQCFPGVNHASRLAFEILQIIAPRHTYRTGVKLFKNEATRAQLRATLLAFILNVGNLNNCITGFMYDSMRKVDPLTDPTTETEMFFNHAARFLLAPLGDSELSKDRFGLIALNARLNAQNDTRDTLTKEDIASYSLIMDDFPSEGVHVQRVSQLFDDMASIVDNNENFKTDKKRYREMIEKWNKLLQLKDLLLILDKNRASLRRKFASVDRIVSSRPMVFSRIMGDSECVSRIKKAEGVCTALSDSLPQLCDENGDWASIEHAKTKARPRGAEASNLFDDPASEEPLVKDKRMLLYDKYTGEDLVNEVLDANPGMPSMTLSWLEGFTREFEGQQTCT